MDRIKQRAREGEENITVAYLSQLEAEHQAMVDNFFGHIIELDGSKCPLELAQELAEIISNLEHD
jgi:deoxyadenosine/deoxycytidine kinase